MEKLKTKLDEMINLSPLSHLYEDGMEIQILTKENAYRITDNLPSSYQPADLLAFGLTGWNANDKASHYVTFDIDSLSNHKNGLDALQLDTVLTECEKVPWVNIYRSTSSKGYHIYVFFDKVVETPTRKDHIKLAYYVKSKLNTILTLDLNSAVDVSGVVSWIYHTEKMTDLSFEHLKTGCDLNINYLDLLAYEKEAKMVRRTQIINHLA